MSKLNLGCGLTKLEGYLNVDVDPAVEPDLIVNICGFLPFQDGEFEEVLFFHTIEHIEKKWHPSILVEIHRILSPKGVLILGYPEFGVCAEYWISNYQGKRDFWEACCFGRQSSDNDYHVCAMDSVELKDLLLSIGFDNIKHGAEPDNKQYTLLTAIKGTPRITYSEYLKDIVFGK